MHTALLRSNGNSLFKFTILLAWQIDVVVAGWSQSMQSLCIGPRPVAIYGFNLDDHHRGITLHYLRVT